MWSTNRFDTLVILFWRHILLVVWKCLILCQIIVIYGKCWFSSFIQRKRRLKSIESSKKLTEMKAKNLRRRWIGSIARWWSVTNARRACFSIRSYSPSHFQVIAYLGNDSKTRNLGSLWFEVTGRWLWDRWWDQVETITGERYRTQLMRLSRALRENDHNTSRGTKKWFYNIKTLGLTFPNPLKSTWKRSNEKCYPTRRIPQILRCTTVTCSGPWLMVWLISSSAHMKTSKNGLIRWWPQKMSTFTVTIFELYQKDEKKL